MITNVDLDYDESKPKSKKSISAEMNSHTNNLKAVRTFQMHSSSPLQFVVTKTFIGMLDTISKAFIVSSEDQKYQDNEEYDTYELEEDILIEQFRDRINKKNQIENKVILMDDEENEEELNDENPSFNFLIKNELGYDLQLEALSGFKFQNLDLLKPDKPKDMNIDKVLLKDNSYCPISLEYDLMGTLNSSIRALEEPERQKKSMKFKLQVN